MKIVHIVDSMEIGGAETLVAQMCRGQRELGHHPSVAAIASLGPLGEQLRKEGFAVEANMARHLSDALPNFYRFFKALRPDVVHLHNPTPSIYAGPSARLAGVPSIVSTRHSLVAPPRRFVAEFKYGVASRFCDSIVGICDATVDNLKSLHTIPGRKISRIYNGTTPIEPLPIAACPPKQGFTLLFVGRLAPVKNLPLLLNAFRIALASEPGLRLWILGDGSERKPLEGIAQTLDLTRQVTFWGERLDVAQFYSVADAFIMSSDSEGLPMSLLQAFSVGLPAVVTDVGGMAEVVRHSQAGIIAAPRNPEALAQAILALAGSSDLRARYSRQAQAAFHSQFTLTAMLSSYNRLYRRGASPA